MSAEIIEIPRSASRLAALEVAVEAARRAGGLLIERYHSEKSISYKGRADMVTDVDLAAEGKILALLREEYPDFGILSEESPAESGESGFTWIVDPLDGTRNYALQVPHFCVMVALAHGNEPVIGVTYDPLREEIFTAETGKGAFMNGMAVEATRHSSLEECVLAFEMGYIDDMAAKALKLVGGLWPNMQAVRVMGSAGLGLAYAACGRVDLFFHHKLSPWDIAAGIILTREAGGLVVDRYGGSRCLEDGSVIASSPHIVQCFFDATEGMDWRQ